ncbi:acyl-CoA N-acyltransferase [Fennellomyces sp. T-0311]|nr:acyl-CoA N-acyltransferase [Fennellomyces sp. T-0311]
MDVKIVQPDATYAKALSELGARLFSDTFSDDNPPDDLKAFLDSTYSPEIQTQELNNPDMYTYMVYDASNETVPVAFCQLRQSSNVYDFVGDPEAIELQRIYVDKRCAGKGIGKKLLNECIAKAKELGKKTIWLGVWEFNPSAIKFYESQGFRKVGSHTFKIGDKLDTDEIMIKTL